MMNAARFTGWKDELFSRREFLQRAGTTALCAALLPLNLPLAPHKSSQAAEQNLKLGRVTTGSIVGRSQPGFDGEKLTQYARDTLLRINSAVLGDEDAGQNRIWYWVNQESYVHSGNIQPVAENPQIPLLQIDGDPVLAEVCMPFTDSVWNIRYPSRSAYRFYYGSTVWIEDVLTAPDGSAWYRIRDDMWGYTYFIRGEHLRVVQPADIAPLSPQVPLEMKRVDVHLPEQMVIAYEGGTPVFMARCATGAKFSSGDYRTPAGIYVTNRKRPSRHMAASSYDLPGIPWVSYILDNGISFHGTYWHNQYGQPRSHGCINLTPQDALWIYRWTSPAVPLEKATIEEKTGTMVNIIEEETE
jgi:hypothetical protein